MGIKGLTQLLKRFNLNHISLVPLENLAGEKIAVDATLFVCVLKMRSGKYVESIVEFLTTFREHGIHPFFVFDGIAPPEKFRERQERASKRNRVMKRIETLERDLEQFKQTGEISETLENIPQNCRRLAGPEKLSETQIQKYIEKLKSEILILTPEDFELMKRLLKIFDIPFVRAEGEAEIYCAALNKLGLVDAVMTTDSDALAALAPTVITRIETIGNEKYFSMMSLDKILTGLNLSPESFRDLCIMCGTDFNSNMPKIACVRAFELVSKFKSIDNLPKEYDTTCLNFERAREIFNWSIPDDSVPFIPFSGRINYNELATHTPNWEQVKERTKPIKVISD